MVCVMMLDEGKIHKYVPAAQPSPKDLIKMKSLSPAFKDNETQFI